MADETFDVFFSYNSKDRNRVREIRQSLEARGVRVWMDEQQIDPGTRWMEELQEIIPKASASAIFLGPYGLGQWQKPEIEACIAQNVKRKMSVVPVPLPGWPEGSELLPFLSSFSWVDLRHGVSSEELDRLAQALGAKEIILSSSSPTSLAIRAPRLHNLPFLPLDNLLKGRDEELQRLITNLQSSAQATAIAQAIHGLGGIGKTRLAVEYAWRSGDRYDTALFVVADSPEALRSGLASLARPDLLALIEYDTGAEARTVEAVISWFRDHSRWLLILDNVDTGETAGVVRGLLPRFGKGHVLLTSRRRGWPRAVKNMHLDELSERDAIQFLLQSTAEGRTVAQDDDEQVARLADILGGLPLALEQAAAQISHLQMTFAEYLDYWEQGRDKILEWHDPAILEYPLSIAATWLTTFERLSQKASTLLRLTAFLAPDPIAQAMLEEGQAIIDNTVANSREKKPDFAPTQTLINTLAELAAYSMVTRSNGTFTVHPLVQEVLRAQIPEASRREWIEFTLLLVDNYSPSDPEDIRTWPIWDLLRPHAARISATADGAGILTPTSRLMNHLALHLFQKSLYAQAEPLMRRSLAIDESCLGPNHSTVATRLNNLAQLLHVTNRWSEAEPLMRRALAINEACHGPDHPTVATCLNNLASLLQTTNRLAEAEPLKRRALAIDEAYSGPDHPDVSRDLNNLAQLLKATGRLLEAEPLMRRALEIDEAFFGPNHPNNAISLNNLALLLKEAGRLQEAEPLIRRALEIDESFFGPNHPNVARNLNTLAQWLKATNRLQEAEPLTYRALAIDEASFGPNHPKVAIRLNNLAQLFRATNRLQEAEPLIRRALAIDKSSFGPYHPKVAIRLNNLGQLLKAADRLLEAEPLLRRALEIFEKSLGSDHARTRNARKNLKALIESMRQDEPT